MMILKNDRKSLENLPTSLADKNKNGLLQEDKENLALQTFNKEKKEYLKLAKEVSTLCDAREKEQDGFRFFIRALPAPLIVVKCMFDIGIVVDSTCGNGCILNDFNVAMDVPLVAAGCYHVYRMLGPDNPVSKAHNAREIVQLLRNTGIW